MNLRGCHVKHLTLSLVFTLLSAPTLDARTWAQFALGGGYEATLFVSNKTAFRWPGEIRIFQGMNQRWSGSWSINGQNFTGKDLITFALDARQTQKFVFRGDSVTRAGYLDLDGTGVASTLDVATAYFYSYYSGSGQLLDTVGSPESPWGKKFFFPAEVTGPIDTGLAWCPSSIYSSSPWQVIASAYDESGKLVSQRSVTANGQQAQFISQLLPSLPKPFRGQIYLDGSDYFHLEVLRLEQTGTGFQLTSTPADDFVP